MSSVYISSTFHDLHEHRRAVSLAIRRLDHTDVAMEYYVAENARPLDRCLRDASSCDLYLGLFARRYGFRPPGEDRSITELELRAAQKAGVDCLCFLLSDDAEWPEEHVERGAGAEKLATLREELCNHYLAGFFSTPDELAAGVSASVVRNLELGRTPFDAMREHRLMKDWRSTSVTPVKRVKAGQALANMGSPRYVAEVKDRLLEADAENDVDNIARYLDELQHLVSSRRELMPIFLDLLESGSHERRYLAVFQLGELALRGVGLSPKVLEKLLQRVEDSSSSIRAQLAHAVGKLTTGDRAHPGVRETLQQLLEDDIEEVREEAQRSSEKWG